MNNDELKKKIVAVLKPFIKAGNISCNEENACKKCWFPCEIERTSERLADALVAAGIGDVKEAERKAFVYSKEIAHLDKELKEAQHRAEVAERALKNLAQLCAKGARYYLQSNKAVKERERELYDEWVKQAEKELAEERKDD